MSSNGANAASSFLGALPPEDEPSPRRERKAGRNPDQVPAQAPEPPIPGVPEGPRITRVRPEPKHKISVNIPLTVKEALEALYARDRLGPQTEITNALLAHLASKGITKEEWKG